MCGLNNSYYFFNIIFVFFNKYLKKICFLTYNMLKRYKCGFCNTSPDQISHHKSHLKTEKHSDKRKIFELSLLGISNKELKEKYGTYEQMNAVHHYETTEVKNKQGAIITAAGLQVDSDFSVTYYDALEEGYNTKYPVTSVTNYDYEQKLQDDKRNIFTLKPRYLNVVKDDLKEMMEYKKGSTQYKSKTLKTADNIRLFT